jgi:hypothetical protein
VIPPKFAVTGTGRCGTGFASEVLCRAGIWCGHEKWWAPEGPFYSGMDGDSSWMAITAGKLPPFLMLTRHPLGYVESQLRAPEWGKYAEIKSNLIGVVEDPIERALREWNKINRFLLERNPIDVLRIEDVQPWQIVLPIARQFELHYTMTASELTPRNVNSHGDRSFPISWREVSHVGSDVFYETCQITQDLGYE